MRRKGKVNIEKIKKKNGKKNQSSKLKGVKSEKTEIDHISQTAM